MRRRNGIPAGAFMASFSSAGRLAPAAECVNCKAQPARHDSIYCSEPCRREFLLFPEYAKRTQVACANCGATQRDVVDGAPFLNTLDPICCEVNF
jgi:hypothetical protein